MQTPVRRGGGGVGQDSYALKDFLTHLREKRKSGHAAAVFSPHAQENARFGGLEHNVGRTKGLEQDT